MNFSCTVDFFFSRLLPICSVFLILGTEKKDSELGRGRVLYTPFNVSFTNSKEALTQIYCNFTFFKTSVLIWTHSFAKKKVKEIWLIKGLKSNLFIKQYNQCFSVIILKKSLNVYICVCVHACTIHGTHVGPEGSLQKFMLPYNVLDPEVDSACQFWRKQFTHWVVLPTRNIIFQMHCGWY